MPELATQISEYDETDLKKTVKNLYDTIMKLRKELDWLTKNLDEDNVHAVSGDWTYSGSITAAQVDVKNGKIKSAQIESLVVGGNVTMGSLATISWGNVTSQPFIPDDGYITNITEDTIYTTNVYAQNLQVKAANITGTLSADRITAGYIQGRLESDALSLRAANGVTPGIEMLAAGASTWLTIIPYNETTIEFSRDDLLYPANISCGKINGYNLYDFATESYVDSSISAIDVPTHANSGGSSSIPGHNHGIADGTKLMIDGGGTVTWSAHSGWSIGSHSHSLS